LYDLQYILNENKLDLISLNTENIKSISNKANTPDTENTTNKTNNFYLVKIICYKNTDNLFIKESLDYNLNLKYKEFNKLIKK